MNKTVDINIVFAGDVNLSGKVEEYFTANSITAEKAVCDDLLGADLVIVNLEGPISDRGEINEYKHVTMKAGSVMIDALVRMGVGVCTLANNHITDFGKAAVEDTIALLRSKKIGYAGVGADSKVARDPLVMEVKGAKVGILSYTDIQEVWAGPSKYGAAREKKEEVLKDIDALKEKADILILALHTGVEYASVPDKDMVRDCREYIDRGVSIVACHHPHVLQGIEEYGRGLIAYSLGNFIFEPRETAGTDSRLTESCVLRVACSADGIKSKEVLPVKLNRYGVPFYARGEEKEEALRNVRRLSAYLEDEGELGKLQDNEDSRNFKRQSGIILNDIKEKGLPYLLYTLRTRRIKIKHFKTLFKMISGKAVKRGGRSGTPEKEA